MEDSLITWIYFFIHHLCNFGVILISFLFSVTLGNNNCPHSLSVNIIKIPLESKSFCINKKITLLYVSKQKRLTFQLCCHDNNNESLSYPHYRFSRKELRRILVAAMSTKSFRGVLLTVSMIHFVATEWAEHTHVPLFHFYLISV